MGNTGIAMAMISRIRGYEIKIVLPGNVSIERRQLLEVYGAEIIDSAPARRAGTRRGAHGPIALADEHPDWVFLYQYGNEANPLTHYPDDRTRDLPRRARTYHALRGRARHVGHPDGRRPVPQGAEPRRQVAAGGPPSGEQVEGLRSLEDGYIPPVFYNGATHDLLNPQNDRAPPASPSSTPGSWPTSASFAGISANPGHSPVR